MRLHSQSCAAIYKRSWSFFLCGSEKKFTDLDGWTLRSKKLDQDKIYEVTV
jgi:hypothetical protein